jgi:flagella basal body P-ring formation protein FlgA
MAGAAVTITVRVGALEVRADGRLLHAAGIGEAVRVHNQATGAVVRGVLVAADQVEL